MSLPDVLAPNLLILFCGTAAGEKSASESAYYAHHTNRFWKTLHKTELTKAELTPAQYEKLKEYRIGLTDLVKDHVGGDKKLTVKKSDIQNINRIIEEFKPRIVAFTSKRTAKEFLSLRSVEYGVRLTPNKNTTFFVLPSPSGSAARWWNEKHWSELAELAKILGKTSGSHNTSNNKDHE